MRAEVRRLNSEPGAIAIRDLGERTKQVLDHLEEEAFELHQALERNQQAQEHALFVMRALRSD